MFKQPNKDANHYRNLFTEYKSKVTRVIANSRKSGYELDLEIKSKFATTINNQPDLLTYYCYLEWKEDFNKAGWLSGIDQDISNEDSFIDLTSSTPSKKIRIEEQQLFKDTMGAVVAELQNLIDQMRKTKEFKNWKWK